MTINVIEYATDNPGWTEEQKTDFLPRTLLTLDRARRELRVPPGDDGQDSLIREQIEAAASFASEDLNTPILQESVYIVLRHDRLDLPITITNPSDPFVLAASKVRYQLASVEIYIPGDWPLEIEIGESDQIAPCSGDGDLIAGNIIVKPPKDTGTWPQAAQNDYVLFYERGVKSASKNVDTYRQLVILKLRELFYGSPILKSTEENSAYGRLASNLRYLGLLPDFKRVD